MTSCKPTRSSAYSEDLHWRMVWQREALGYDYEWVARSLCLITLEFTCTRSRTMAEVLMLEVSIAMIFRCLKANGFTRQKLRTTAIQQDEYLRQQYVQDISVYSSDMLLFVDETGADGRNVIRK